ncbi:hypothetical protein CPC08DRAFT_134903 [Agrocybe pediades]|nr:hypothetical protein CPC08DRAFT_134903 [Agrocybe pediades]
MLASSDSPRPLPPAKARRASAMLRKQQQQRVETGNETTPPPAYGSITLPSAATARRAVQPTILGSPLTNTFHMVGWDVLHAEQHADHHRHEDLEANSNQLPSPPPEGEDGEWMNERSREELKDLLVKADGIIRERENELGITSAVARGLYQNNVTLQSKHQALLSRLPPRSRSPIPSSTSSPDAMNRVDSESSNFSSSTSESALGLVRSPKPSFYRGHTRKTTVATADISLLADQNAELLDKLEKLESEATSADHAGRRELKRLEKEITYLREALEKTQMKSEELEEKVQEAVVGDVWRRKKEREAKFRAMRNMGREREEEDTGVRDFAPGGSTFGGPTDAYSLFPTSGGSDPQRKGLGLSTTNAEPVQSSVVPAEHSLIAQLLQKVQELEQTNTRILQQQSETANQLSAVQRDTAQIAKVYETLADSDSSDDFGEDVDEDDFDAEFSALNRSVSKRQSRAFSSQTVKSKGVNRSSDIDFEEFAGDLDDNYRGLNRSISKRRRTTSLQTVKSKPLHRQANEQETQRGTCIVHPEFPHVAGKSRKTVMGLFDEQSSQETVRPPDTRSEDVVQSLSRSLSSWNDSHGRSSWSSIQGGLVSPPRSLSPLHFFSPSSENLDLSPLGSRPTLQSELSRLGDGDWSMELNSDTKSNRPHHHLRTSSLYDLSQISVPPSPSPLSRVGSKLPGELDFDARTTVSLNEPAQYQSHTPLLMSANTLRLSVEPPTPDKAGGMFKEGRSTAVNTSYEDPLNTRSPRIKMMSDTLRSRSSRWTERRNLAQPTATTSTARPGPRGWDAYNHPDGHEEDVEEAEEQKTPSGGGAGALAPPQLMEIPVRFSNALDNLMEDFQGFSVLDEFTGSSLGSGKELEKDNENAPAISTPPSPSAGAEDQDVSMVGSYSASDLHDHEEPAAPAPPTAAAKTKNSDGILLQVWLWLQFAILMLVFVYAMAKRGPSAALAGGDASRSGAVVRRR